jgi:hypothetical protein
MQVDCKKVKVPQHSTACKRNGGHFVALRQRDILFATPLGSQSNKNNIGQTTNRLEGESNVEVDHE